MHIWKSPNIFVFIRKYVEGFHIKTRFTFPDMRHLRYVKSMFTNIQKQ